ncbi:MAG: hypothetical protein MHMPM18_000273 [Marteilia pararefringens]
MLFSKVNHLAVKGATFLECWKETNLKCAGTNITNQVIVEDDVRALHQESLDHIVFEMLYRPFFDAIETTLSEWRIYFRGNRSLIGIISKMQFKMGFHHNCYKL